VDVTDVLRDRMQQPGGLQRMLSVSITAHALLAAVVIFAPGGLLHHTTAAPTVMTISLGGGGGERAENGGMTPMGGRPIQEVKPADEPVKREPIRPPAAKAPEMTMPLPNAKPTKAAPAAKPVKSAPEEARGRTPTRGDKVTAGSTDCVGNGVSRLGAAGAAFTLQGADFPILLFHLNHQVRKLNIQVFKADGSSVHPVFNYVSQDDFLGRNSTATTFFEFDWNGTRSQDNGGGNGDHRKAVPNGRYVLKLSVLKALGNASNAADWETFTTPPITLARP